MGISSSTLETHMTLMFRTMSDPPRFSCVKLQLIYYIFTKNRWQLELKMSSKSIKNQDKSSELSGETPLDIAHT